MSDQEWTNPSTPPTNPYGGPPPFGRVDPPGQPHPYGTPNPYGGPSPYGPQHGVGYRPPASRTMAGWALGLTLFLCVPFLPALIGIVLAVVVLRRARDGRDHGSGLAIAALVVGPLAVLLWLATVVVAVLDPGSDTATRDDQGAVVEGGEIGIDELRVGDCFDDPALDDPDAAESSISSVEAVPCGEPHQLEVFFDSRFADRSYPGEERTFDLAMDRCISEFREFVGRGYARSEIEVYAFYPDERSWNVGDNRAFACMVTDPAGPVTGTLRDARR